MTRTFVLACFVVGGCNKDGAAFSFVTPLQGTTAYLGLVGNSASVAAYVCDGTPDKVAIAEWLEGSVTDGSFTIDADSGAAVTGEIGDRATGTVTLPDGTTADFDAAAADSTASGLFRGEGTADSGADFLGGWILVSEDDQRGAVTDTSTGVSSSIMVIAVNTTTATGTVGTASATLRVSNYINAYIVSPRE